MADGEQKTWNRVQYGKRAGTVHDFVSQTEGGKLYERALDFTKRTANDSNVMQEAGKKWRAARGGEKYTNK